MSTIHVYAESSAGIDDERVVDVWSPSTTMQTATGSLSHPQSVSLRVSVSHSTFTCCVLQPPLCLEFPLEARPPWIAAGFIYMLLSTTVIPAGLIAAGSGTRSKPFPTPHSHKLLLALVLDTDATSTNTSPVRVFRTSRGGELGSTKHMDGYGVDWEDGSPHLFPTRQAMRLFRV